MKRSSLLLAILAALVSLAAAPSAVDTAFKKFWDASNPPEAARVADAIAKSGVTFEDAYARLKRGRTYSSDVARGVVQLRHHFLLGDFWYSVEVPQNYDPARSYQVRVQMHGGVMGRQDGTIRGNGSIGALAGAEQIYVMPASWKDAPWWNTSQIENMRAIVDTVKRMYNVDENRVVLTGVSDGATAAYYFAMLETTPFASFLTLNGALAVLQSPAIGLNGSLFPQNLVNKPFFIVNGGRDPLYPTSLVEPYIDHIKKNGVEVLYHPQPNGVHNTSWWPEEKDAFETFVREHPRKPFPDHLTWQTDLKGDTNRAHWLVIDKLMDKDDMCAYAAGREYFRGRPPGGLWSAPRRQQRSAHQGARSRQRGRQLRLPPRRHRRQDQRANAAAWQNLPRVARHVRAAHGHDHHRDERRRPVRSARLLRPD